MRKLEQIQQNKLISSYGGVGSIIETNSNGALQILPYDSWPCFAANQLQNRTIVEDPRLLSYITQMYPNITRFLSIPDNDLSSQVYSANAADTRATIGSKYFPEWYFCPHCRRLKKLGQWEEDWNGQFPNDGNFRVNPPACYNCSSQNNNGIRRYPLQQIRFVMASLSGGMEDVPFDRLWGNDANAPVWTLGNVRNRIRDLSYRTLRDGDGLSAIYIERTDEEGNNHRMYLSQIGSKYIVKDGAAYKMTVRGSQSLYFPKIVRSLYIPVAPNDAPTNLDLHEFSYLTDDANFINNMIVEQNYNLVVKRHDELRETQYVRRISAMERLKETSVLLYYTRMGKAGEERQWYDAQAHQVIQMQPQIKRPFTPDFTPTYMPAVEAYGEGLFFEINLNNINRADYETFVHTFCHIVMKEMEFQCGYPLTSLKEKIYIGDNGTAGFLIYTIAGSEGSYGGLISLVQNNRIVDLIERGAERAHYCPNDPICGATEEAHCFACLDISETSCVYFNQRLNRNMFLIYWDNVNQTNADTPDSGNNETSEADNRPSGLIL